MSVIAPIVGAERPAPAETFDDIDPSAGELLASVARCRKSEVDAAVDVARKTFDSGWAKTSPEERSGLLRAIAAGIRGNAGELALLESRDTGKPLSQARNDAAFAARYFEFYADTVQAMHGETIATSPELLLYTLREPHGVTGHIIPWNYPMQVAARTVAAALATGNACVLKPAEEAPLTAIRVGELALDAGLPAGALNVVPGLGEEAGAALAAHPGINHLSFTGSVEVGRSVAAEAGRNLVPVTLELGGKSPNIVFADADLERAIPAIVASILQNCGQTCSAGSRLLVERSVHDRVVTELRERFAAVRIGPGSDDPDLGPLISARQRERVASYVEVGRAEGELVCGGSVPEDDGLRAGQFFSPTIFDRVDPGATIAQEEIFGPVLAVTTFDETEEALAIANGTRFGLLAAVWTRDIGRAHWLAHRLEAGQVFINNYGAGGGVAIPFGGVRESGFGREKGFEALLGYTRTKAVAVAVPSP